MTEKLKPGDSLLSVVCQEIDAHANKLQGKSGKETDWERGFVDGLIHVRDALIPMVYPVTGTVVFLPAGSEPGASCPRCGGTKPTCCGCPPEPIPLRETLRS